MRYILALDEGTTSARAIVFDETGKARATAGRPIDCTYPQEGWVEQDPEQIWQAQLDSAREALAKSGASPGDVAAIGITNQRETTILWDRKTGKAVAPAIVWQDRRTAHLCGELKSDGREPEVTRRTGLLLDPYFSGTKLKYLLDKVGRADNLLFGTVDSWLIYRLTKGRVHATDASNASRTLLYNISERRWDRAMLNMLSIPSYVLPEVRSSSERYGEADASWLGAPIPIAGVAGDQQSALFGQTCFHPGTAKNTYGTGCFLLLHTGNNPVVSLERLLSTVACSGPDEKAFALEGSVFMGGAAVQWMRDSLKLFRTAADSEDLATSVSSTEGVYVVPAFVGLGAPYWDPHARGAILGLTRGSTAAHIARATLESIAYQTRDLVGAMEKDSGVPLAELRVDGGAAENNFLMQFQADILGKPVVRPSFTETTALGAAYLAGLAVGVWKNTAELEKLWQREHTFTPRMADADRERLYSGWKEAVVKVMMR